MNPTTTVVKWRWYFCLPECSDFKSELIFKSEVINDNFSQRYLAYPKIDYALVIHISNILWLFDIRHFHSKSAVVSGTYQRWLEMWLDDVVGNWSVDNLRVTNFIKHHMVGCAKEIGWSYHRQVVDSIETIDRWLHRRNVIDSDERINRYTRVAL